MSIMPMQGQEKSRTFELSGKIIDLCANRIFPGKVTVVDGKISSITELSAAAAADCYILPGFIDSHVHVESSMLVPSEFARLAACHGTVACVADPHEIANVLGLEGINFMLENGATVPFKFFFGAPSCVPATPFETAGASLGLKETETLLSDPRIGFLSEMMNVPGVLFGDEQVHGKLALARKYNKVIDGHAPGLGGDDAKKYIAAGISSDHECVDYQEALFKISCGMKVSIREGSAAKNFDALADLIKEHSDMLMFCSDDKHPDELSNGYINLLVKRAVARGIDALKVLRVACLTAVKHYGLSLGLLQTGDAADFIVIDNLRDFTVQATYINGIKVAENGKALMARVQPKPVNKFVCSALNASDLKVVASGDKIKVLGVVDGQLITDSLVLQATIKNNEIVSDCARDVLKLVVYNRYAKAAPAIGFVKNIGLKRGAIASSVGHDSHNITAVGVNDEDLARAINLVVANKGGVAAVCAGEEHILALPVAGLMSTQDGYEVAKLYQLIDRKAKDFGSVLAAPFMTLSFLSLLVIPHLKLSDKGLFDGDKFSFVSLQPQGE